MELLEALEIGDAVKADCKVEEIDSFYTVLKRTEMLTVNMEELNYLAKRLESFDDGEAAQFQAMAHKLELFELKDLINLTFCCQQATVITDFSDLAAIGRDHYTNLHGGSARVDELEALDGEETARLLIENGSGTITPYGVVYDNGMKLDQAYDGRFFPCYYYEPNAITVAVTAKSEPEDTERITWLFLPMVQEEIDRALLRGGITDPADVRLRLEDSQLPNEVDVLLDMEYETLSDLNELAEATNGLSKADMEKLGAVVMLAEPKSAVQIKNLAESLDLFDFAPGAHTPEEYGKYMIQQSGRFEYDENLDEFYDYEGYALQRMSEEDGMFTDRGYIAYKGYLDINVFADAMLCDIRFKVPYIGELICDTDCPAVEDYNDFAEKLEAIWQKDGMLLTYAAVLDAERPETLHRAVELLQDLDNYQRITEGAYGYGQQRLQETLGLDDEAIYKLEGYMDYEKYGSDCMTADRVIETDFGLLRRLDSPFPEQTQGQQMFQ